MTIISLCFYIAIAALVLTFLISRIKGTVKSLPDSFLQNFCGGLFIFSGLVKAVDPMGTAFKMEEYFKEFELTARGSFLSFSADLFPFLLKFSVGFSVFMIVLEIVIGIMLIIGAYRKLGAWLFFLIMVFFTILTGYTFLTGYVPKDINFFEFSKWTTFDQEFMRVKNCGCFGDFIKLDPRTSFIKDLFLMIPAIWFLLRWSKMHQIFSASIRTALTLMSVIGLSLFCFSNYIWNEPIVDFRPFKNGTDVKTTKEAESKAMSDVKIIAWKLRNKQTNELKNVPDEEYMANLKNFPKTEWEVLDQVKSLPAIPQTKISDFALFDLEGSDITEEILNEPKSRFMINCPKLYFSSRSENVTRQDTIYKVDTIWLGLKKDSFNLVSSVVEVKTVEEKKNVYTWNEKYLRPLKEKILPLLDSLKADNIQGFLVAGGASEEALGDLKNSLKLDIPVYTSDDILLKTIMRSNPGLILWRNGKIIHKWHHGHLPTPNEMRRDFLDWQAPLIH